MVKTVGSSHTVLTVTFIVRNICFNKAYFSLIFQNTILDIPSINHQIDYLSVQIFREYNQFSVFPRISTSTRLKAQLRFEIKASLGSINIVINQDSFYRLSNSMNLWNNINISYLINTPLNNGNFPSLYCSLHECKFKYNILSWILVLTLHGIHTQHFAATSNIKQ